MDFNAESKAGQVKSEIASSIDLALDIHPLFADNIPQHHKCFDRGKYLSGSRQRRGSIG
jgi:hypothetical protein